MDVKEIRRRIIHGSGANAFGQITTIAIQLLSVPVFLSVWDVAKYGNWLILYALPSYLSLGDVGILFAARNKLTMAMGRQEYIDANRVFQSSLVFMLIICSALIILITPVGILIPLPVSSDNFNHRIALVFLSYGVVASLFNGLADAVFRASGHYAYGTVLSTLIRLGEWVGIMVGLVAFGDFAAVAAGGLLMRLFGTAAACALAARSTKQIQWGLKSASLGEIMSMRKPAGFFMLFPLAFAIGFQGMTLVIGYALGPAAVTTFTIYRILSRFIVQIAAILNHALEPEFSLLFGAGRREQVRNLYRRANRMIIPTVLFLGVVFFTCGEWIIERWSHRQVDFQPMVVFSMICAACISSIGHLPRTLLLCTNHHTALAKSFLLLSIFQVFIAFVAAYWDGLLGVANAVVVAELLVTFVCFKLAQPLLDAKSFR